MTTIRSKLFVYFFAFVILFNVVSISVYASTQHFMNQYQSSFERFLILNDISQTVSRLYENVNGYVVQKNAETLGQFFKERKKLLEQKREIENGFEWLEQQELNKYVHMIDTLAMEAEMTIGFVMREDIDQYTVHLRETRNISSYIQETTLNVIDLELSKYQAFNADMKKRNEAFKWFSLSLFTTTVLLAIFFAVLFSRSINVPIQMLTDAAKEVAKGNFHGADLSIRSNDELKFLGETFNQMRKNIRKLIEEIKEKHELDRLLKEMELKHLQNQINPHFLFNTLNTVSRMAYLENAQVTSRLIQSVSTLLRYSLGHLKHSVPLREEVKVVKEYFHIQKTRFADRIAFQTDIDEQLLDVQIPSMTLQPLVENAFIHGIEPMEDGGIIRLKIYKKDHRIIVEVADNGAGMTKEQLQRLLQTNNDSRSKPSGHTTGLGVHNVIRRLELFYQKEDVVEIYSEPGKGTNIMLKLPKGG